MKLNGISEIIFKQIELLCDNRLKKTVTPFDIMYWLQNFEVKEYDLALTVLKYLDVYTEIELVELWNERLKKLITLIHIDVNIIFIPVAEFGKSGTLMMYYLKKTPIYKKNIHRIKIYPTPEQIKYKRKGNLIPVNSIIVLIDDFSGSGKSVLTHYMHYIKPQITGYKNIINAYALIFFCLDQAVELLERKVPELNLIYEIKKKAFSTRGSVFGYRDKMQPIREFCYKYGKGLWMTTDDKGKVIDHALGFENSQALIVFPYNPPNNTLPIIWSNKKGWNPLYSRSSYYKISEAKRIRKELASYISLLDYTDYAFDFKSGKKELAWKTIHFVTKTDFHAFAIMFLIRKKRSKPTIRQILGITETDYNSKIEELKSRSIMDHDGNISEYGKEIYLQVLKQLKKGRKNLKINKNDFKIKNIVYLPKQFKGWSLI